MEIEKLWSAPVHPNSYLWTSPCVQSASTLLGPMSLTRNIWRICSKKCKLCSDSSAMTSFLFHPALPEGLTNTFKPWFEKRLFRFVDIVDYKTLKPHSFESLQSLFQLPRECCYTHTQICSYLQRSLSSTTVSLPTRFERLCRSGSSTKGLISDIYRILLDPDPELSPGHSYMSKWHAILGHELPLDTWRLIWRRAAKTSLCVSHKENQYKLLMFWYHTPSLLNKLNPAVSPLCWRCGNSRGTQFHLFWECPGIRSFWIAVNALLYDILGIRFTLSPQLFILNIPESSIPRYSTKLLIHILTAARCIIALFWKRSSAPSRLDLCSRVKEVCLMEYMTALSHNQVDLFHKIWSLWDFYIAEHDN